VDFREGAGGDWKASQEGKVFVRDPEIRVKKGSYAGRDAERMTRKRKVRGKSEYVHGMRKRQT
jgi:hypothetical protein